MENELREVRRDSQLQLEAYHFQNLARIFPNHFHDGYVIGIVEKGTRRLFCKNREYMIGPGHLVIFHPGDAHGCAGRQEEAFSFRGLSVPRETMLALAEEVTGRGEPPGFSQNIIGDKDLNAGFLALHRAVMDISPKLEREELLLFLFSALMERYGQSFQQSLPPCREEVEAACAFMEERFDQHMGLEDICRHCGLSRSALLRSFTRSKGVTPYRYLQTIRVNRAREMLEHGASPAGAAQQAGFGDQSHFSNTFQTFIGITPGAYRDIFRGEQTRKETAQ